MALASSQVFSSTSHNTLLSVLLTEQDFADMWDDEPGNDAFTWRQSQ